MKKCLLLILVLNCFYKTTLNAQCIIQGPNDGSIFSGNIMPGDQSWSNSGFAQSSDGVYAGSGFVLGVLSTEPTKYLTASGFNFTIPSNAVIAGIQVDIERLSSGVNLLAKIEDEGVRIMKGGTFVGVNKASSNYWPIFNSSYATYGGPNDLWGTTWTPADINSSGFGAAISARLTGLVMLLPGAYVDNIRIRINYSLIPTVTPSSSLICEGDSSFLFAIGNTTYSWSPAMSLSSPTGVNVVATPSVTTTYTVTGLTGNCVTQNFFTINVNPAPVIAISSPAGGNIICEGNSISLSVNGADSYTWSPAMSLSSATGTNVIATPSLTTTYSIVGTSSNGCSNSFNTSTVTVNVNSAPQINLNATANTICNGGSTILSATGADSYTWSPSTGLSSINGASVVASPTTTTVYQVTGSSLNDCNALTAIHVTVTVNNSPVLNLSSTSPGNTICQGQSTFLNASGASSYTWNPATGLNTTIGANIIANPTVTTVYTVVASVTGGCSGTLTPTTLTVIVNNGPTLTTSAPGSTICEGTGGTLTASGASSYSWSPSYGLSSTTGASVIASPSITTVYSVLGMASNGCDNSFNPTTFTVSVNSSPDITINSTSLANTICEGTTATLTATGANTYTWSPTISLSTAHGSSVVASPTVTTVYTITGTGSNGCGNTLSPASLTVTVNSSPTVSLSSTASGNSLCQGGNAGLMASGASSYTWSPSSSLNSSTGGNVIASPSVTTVYTVLAESDLGCSNITAPQTLTITVYPIPNINILSNVTGDSICLGQPITLSVSGTATTYTWNNGMNLPTITVTPTTNTVYDVISTNSSSCSASGSIYVVVVNPASVNLSLLNYSITTAVNTTVCSNVSVGSILSGPVSDIAITQNPIHGSASIANGVITYTPNYNYDGTDTVYYSVCDVHCQSVCKTAKLLVIIESDVLVPEVLSPNGDGVHDDFHIKGLSKYPDPELVIFNRWGEIVYYEKPYANNWSGQASSNSMKISGTEVLDGTYFYLLTLNSETKAMKGFFELKRK